ncbi:MAG: hypothetical protein E6I17_03175 [Chloroflexi bacterium]|nr:MAG: hypothetical protein E6I17_03175 [Chloroflexota bacterium]
MLAVADEVDESLYGDVLPRLNPDLVLSCGDLPSDYLEYLVSRLDVPLLYVPGNHDPSLEPPDMSWMPLRTELPPAPGPQGCVNIDGRIVQANGLRIAGLGGSIRHIHPYGRQIPERRIKAARVINVVPSRMIEI